MTRDNKPPAPLPLITFRLTVMPKRKRLRIHESHAGECPCVTCGIDRKNYAEGMAQLRREKRA